MKGTEKEDNKDIFAHVRLHLRMALMYSLLPCGSYSWDLGSWQEGLPVNGVMEVFWLSSPSAGLGGVLGIFLNISELAVTSSMK